MLVSGRVVKIGSSPKFPGENPSKPSGDLYDVVCIFSRWCVTNPGMVAPKFVGPPEPTYINLKKWTPFPKDPITLSDDEQGVYNHILSKVFKFHYHSQKVIGSLGISDCLIHNLLMVLLGRFVLEFRNSLECFRMENDRQWKIVEKSLGMCYGFTATNPHRNMYRFLRWNAGGAGL